MVGCVVNEKCIVTIADAELDTLLKTDKDLTFMVKKVEVDISQVKKRPLK